MWFLIRSLFRPRGLHLGDPGRIPGGPSPPVPCSSSSARGSVQADAPVPLTASMDITATDSVVEDIAIIPDSTRTSMCGAVDLDDLPRTVDQVRQTCREQVACLDQSLERYNSAIRASRESVLDDLSDSVTGAQVGSTSDQNTEFIHPDPGFNPQSAIGAFAPSLDMNFTPEYGWSTGDVSAVGPGAPALGYSSGTDPAGFVIDYSASVPFDVTQISEYSSGPVDLGNTGFLVQAPCGSLGLHEIVRGSHPGTQDADQTSVLDDLGDTRPLIQ